MLVGTRPTRASQSSRAISRSPSCSRTISRPKAMPSKASIAATEPYESSPTRRPILSFSIGSRPACRGPEICIRLRACDATRMLPIIMLSTRGEEVLRLRGFSAGADDFVVKPFSMRELIARVRGLVRRSRSATSDHLLTRGDLQLDRQTRRVRRCLRDVHLRPTQFRLLECLLERPGSVFSRHHLLERVWGPSVDA